MKKLFLLLTLGLLALGAYWKWPLILSYFNQKTLVIGLNTATTDLSPYGLDLNNLTRTANMYEGLVTLDKNLNVLPALAVSWGNLSPTQWEFKLREGVKFHDGSVMVAQDILNAFEAAKKTNNPQIKPIISSIKNMQVNETGTLFVDTNTPDPLLLSKLSKFFITKQNNIGTGPYTLSNETPQTLTLEAFSDYWGQAPFYQKAKYTVEPNWGKREADFKKGKIDLLGSVTPDLASTLSENQLLTDYGLEVNFLMFKLDDPIFKQKSMRQAVQKLIDPAKLEAIGNHLVRPASQFISEGVFGYNPDLKPFNYQAEQEPRDLFGLQLQKTQLVYPASFRTLGEYLSEQLEKAGFQTENKVLSAEQLLQTLQTNSAPLYLTGWQAQDGDAGGFFDTFIHSQGSLNGGRYKNRELDQKIEQARQEMNPQVRLKLLREIGAKLQEDLVGIPLFETQRLYAKQPNLKWQPRLDGLILAADASPQ